MYWPEHRALQAGETWPALGRNQNSRPLRRLYILLLRVHHPYISIPVWCLRIPCVVLLFLSGGLKEDGIIFLVQLLFLSTGVDAYIVYISSFNLHKWQLLEDTDHADLPSDRIQCCSGAQ